MTILTLKRSMVGLALSVVACAGGEKTVVEPPAPGSGDFTITVRADASESAAATALGWSSGIPGAQVTLTAADGSTRTATSSSAGVATFAGVGDGKYDLSTRRVLTATEVAKVASGDMLAFVSGDSINVSTSSKSQTISALASRKGSLMISEWSFQEKNVTGIGTYSFGGFLELYNNADTTVYLDGLTIAEVISDPVEFPNFSCAMLGPFRNDPQGAWSRYLAAFPGSGRDYPVAPGAVTVVATDAIDHRIVEPDLLDLSRANFEFLGEADVDNPAVANMIDESLQPYFGGHGISGAHSALAAVWIVAGRINPSQLTHAPIPPNALETLRIPTAMILDAFAARNTGLLDPSLALTPCPELVNRNIDRQEGFFLQGDPDAFSRSASRKVLVTLNSGRVILQNTHQSKLDFRVTARSPGSIQ
jgi:hypothetical protein